MGGSAYRWGSLAAFGLLSALPQFVSATEPCKLLTVQEIGHALGGSVSPPTPLGANGCLWKGSPGSLTLVLRSEATWARLTAPGPGVVKTNLSGLGEAASISHMEQATEKNLQTLSVKQGANVIVLTIIGINDTERQRSAEESLARLALPRL